MKKVYDYIFGTSPKKLAIYLVLCPAILFLLYTVFTIGIRNISDGFLAQKWFEILVLGSIYFFFLALALLWLVWLRGVVYSVSKEQLGLPKKWFTIAYAILIIFIIFNSLASVIESLTNEQSWGYDYLYLIYASREFINFSGIMVAYPIVCHYAARSAIARRNKKPATFVSSIPFTLLLIFGTVAGVPFLHKHFSKQPSTNSQIMVVYAIAFGIFALLLITGFIAAITGLV